MSLLEVHKLRWKKQPSPTYFIVIPSKWVKELDLKSGDLMVLHLNIEEQTILVKPLKYFKWGNLNE